MRRALLPLTCLIASLVLAAPAAAQGPAPRGFVGISPQGQLGVVDFELMQLAGVESVRLPLFWSQVEPTAAGAGHRDWSSFDAAVEGAAQHFMTVFPFLWGTPAWVSPSKIEEPVARAWQRRAWLRFVGAAVRRYGPNGRFWRLNPDLPEEPILQWEVWNEENIVTFSHNPDPERFARLIRFTGRLIHRLDPGSRVIAGGFFGRPLQIPPNVGSGDFLARLYRAGGVKPFFDGVALHPYVARAKAMGGQIRNLRRVMRKYGDASTPLYVTELGWGSDGFESRWERGWRGQARELDRAFAMLTRNRARWKIGGAWWFSWADTPSTCQFCDSAGLLTLERRAKPSWYAFNEWTRGDADAVPRGSAVESLDGP